MRGTMHRCESRDAATNMVTELMGKIFRDIEKVTRFAGIDILDPNCSNYV